MMLTAACLFQPISSWSSLYVRFEQHLCELICHAFQRSDNSRISLFHSHVEPYQSVPIVPQHVSARFGFVLEVWINGAHAKRHTACCPFSLKAGTSIIHNVLRVLSTSGGMPCYKCIGKRGGTAASDDASSGEMNTN